MQNNLFLFTGEETYLIHEQINAWKEAFIKKHGDINLAILNGAEISIGEIITDVDAMPFLGDKRLIFIENLPEAPKARSSETVSKKDEARQEELKKLIEHLKKIPETSVVVFVQSKPDKRKSFYKQLVKITEVKEFNSLSGMALTKWIQVQAQKKGGKIDQITAEYLVSLTGHNLWRLTQEITKLVSFLDGQLINQSAIDQVVTPTLEANIFHFTDALGAKDHKKAIHNLHRTIAAGENLRQTFYMIVRQFRLLLQVSGYLFQSSTSNPNATAIAAALKMHPFVARNVLGQLKHFTRPELNNAYERLLEIDFALKTSQIRITIEDQDELALAIERFILRFCT